MKNTIIKWYKKLGFPEKYDEQFYDSLNKLDVINAPSPKSAKELSLPIYTPEQRLIYSLLFCERTEEKYKALGIDEAILLATLYDIVIWTNTHYDMSGIVGLVESSWLWRHLEGCLFKLGRLQFCIAGAEHSFDVMNSDGTLTHVNEGDGVVEIHIPEGEPLLASDCLKSLERAEEFISKYFPEHSWQLYTCHSWLLDGELRKLVSPKSNILHFAELFEIISSEPSDAALKYIFRRDATRENLYRFEARSSLARAMKTHASSGGALNEALGIIRRHSV